MATQEPPQADPWLHKKVDKIDYFVHRPTRQSGIHIRGLAALCGVGERSIRSAIEKVEKIEEAQEDLRKIRETLLSNILKNREIFLVDLRKISPRLNGREVKVILASVCFDIAFYYAEKGYKEALKTVGDMGRLGAESFVFYKTGFDITEHLQVNRMVVDGIEVLTYATQVEVNKTTTGEVVYYTDRKTGQCGISLTGLYHLCGGIVSKTKILEYLNTLNNQFVMAGAQGEDIIDASAAEQALYYYGHTATPRKSQKAKNWLASMGTPISKFIANHTGYTTTAGTTDTDTLRKCNEALQRENERLRKQLGFYDEQGIVRWHLLMGTTLDYQLRVLGATLKAEVETAAIAQRVDFVIENLRLHTQGRAVLDGLDPAADHNLITYKSHHEALDADAINELISYFVEYKKGFIKQGMDNKQNKYTYHLVAVCTRYPEALAKQAGNKWSQIKPGVYNIDWLVNITVIVTSKVTMQPRNSAWLLFSHDRERVEYALNLPENAQIPEYIPKLLRDELDKNQ